MNSDDAILWDMHQPWNNPVTSAKKYFWVDTLVMVNLYLFKVCLKNEMWAYIHYSSISFLSQQHISAHAASSGGSNKKNTLKAAVVLIYKELLLWHVRSAAVCFSILYNVYHIPKCTNTDEKETVHHVTWAQVVIYTHILFWTLSKHFITAPPTKLKNSLS